VLLVVLPIAVLCKLPAYIAPLTPRPPVTTSVPEVVELDTVLAVNVVDPLDVKLVKAPVFGLVDPMLILDIVPAVLELIAKVPPEPIVVLPPGLIVTVPLVPVGLSVTARFAPVTDKFPPITAGTLALPTVSAPPAVFNVSVAVPVGLIVTLPPG
jgi:hypothetical protein